MRHSLALGNRHRVPAHRVRRSALGMLAVAITLVPCTGCGPSQEDLIMRAAKRKRPTSDESLTRRRPNQENPSYDENLPETPIAKTETDGSAKPNGKAEPRRASAIELTLATIEERNPTEPLTEAQRRARAYDNLTKLSEALQKYYQKNDRYPQSFSTTRGGIAALSWRVELLPYLGHDELFQQFDFSKPWDFEPNKSLLKYIPDEYVSPERFDTSTNFLLPADKHFMFGQNRSPRLNDIEDGAESTIMLLEVDDSSAVPWTKPIDYEPSNPMGMGGDLGNLRSDGTFALWANGWTVLLAGGLSHKQMFNALSYETGDGQRAGDIHRNISIEGITAASLTARAPEPSTEQTPGKFAGPAIDPMPLQPELIRAAVPKAGERANAKKKLRKIYATRIGDARTDDEKLKLANQMLADAASMSSSDDSGAYALQSAAIRLAIDGGDPSVLIKSIDHRVGRFDVDAYDENATWLTNFGQVAVTRDPETVDGKDLLRRAVRVMYAGIEDNDFVRASAIARITYRYTGQEPRDPIPRSLKRLRVLLSSANKEYGTASEQLATYRDNPSDQHACGVFGRFLCFIKGDWSMGLPLLADGDNLPLQELAKRDLRGAADIDNLVAIGDAWWELSERARSGIYRQAAQDRAIYWYKQAYETMPDSLDRMHVKARMDEASDSDGSSPLAICIQLADELSIDLEISLAAVADVGQKGGNRRVDDEEE